MTPGPSPAPPAYPTVPQTSNGQYDFIMDAGGNPGGASSSMTKRILIVAGGALLLIIVAWIFMATAFKGASLDTASLITITQQQNELSRISADATKNAEAATTINFAANTELSLESSQSNILSFMKKNGKKVDNKTLLLTKSTKTDTQLAEAKASGTYDAVYLEIAQSQLTHYSQSLKSAFNNASGSTERQLLSNAYSQAQLLLEQSKAH